MRLWVVAVFGVGILSQSALAAPHLDRETVNNAGRPYEEPEGHRSCDD